MFDVKKILNELPSLYISDRDYNDLMNALKISRLNSQGEELKKQKDAWLKIIEDIDAYEEEYGLIKVEVDNCEGEWTFSLCNGGKIRIERDD